VICLKEKRQGFILETKNRRHVSALADRVEINHVFCSVVSNPTTLSSDLQTLRNSAANNERHLELSGSDRYFDQGTVGFSRLFFGAGA
jgi:hypothetical protein